MIRICFLLSLIVLLGGCVGGRGTAGSVEEFEPGPIASSDVALHAQSTPHRIELLNFDPATRPAVAVFDTAGRQVAGGQARADRLSLEVPGHLNGRHTVIVRSLGSAGSATADLWLDGRLSAAGIRYSAGREIRVPSSRGKVAVLGVRPPRGAASHIAVLLSADGMSVQKMSSGVATRIDLPSGGNHRVVFGSSVTGPIRTFVNQIDDDSDGDGLSDWIEHQLKTCPSRQGSAPGVDCAAVADSRDTDGDALWDSWEVLGFDGSFYGLEGGQHLPLAAWGADPRHKDVFLEVDFRRLDKAENDANLAAKMPPAKAREMAAIYADEPTTDPALRSLHAGSTKNPDGRPGISLHLDIGVEPESSGDATIYGDWGGYNAVNALPDPANPGVFLPQRPGVWREQMAKSRHGIFHYVLGYKTGGGSCGYRSIGCGFNFEDTFISVHEFGHTFGLGHAGLPDSPEPNCKPNYPSVMSYAPKNQFSDGQAIGTLNNHALAETGALSPNHELLGRLRTDFKYKVDSASGSVDWNRDGQFAPAGTLVRAYASYLPGGGCEYTRAGETTTRLTSNRSPAIVRFNGHLWIFAVTPQKKLIYTSTPQPFVCPNPDRCPTPAFHQFAEREVGEVEGVDAVTMNVNGRPMILVVGRRTDGSLFETWMVEGVGQFIWSGPNAIPASPAGGEPALAVSHDGRRVALAYRGSDGLVRYRFRTDSGFESERTVTVGGSPLQMGLQASPALAFARLRLPADVADVGTEHLIGAFIHRGVELYAFKRSSQAWGKLAIPYEPMPEAAGSSLDLERFAMGRPALAWVGPAPGQALPADAPRGGPVTYARLYVLYIEMGPSDPSHPSPNPVRMAMSYVDPNSGILRIGLDSFFDNVWSFAHGIDLLQPGEIGLRAAETYVIKKAGPWNEVYFRPHADGMADRPYGDHDDWKLLGWGACTTLANVQASQVKVGCLPQYW